MENYSHFFEDISQKITKLDTKNPTSSLSFNNFFAPSNLPLVSQCETNNPLTKPKHLTFIKGFNIYITYCALFYKSLFKFNFTSCLAIVL